MDSPAAPPSRRLAAVWFADLVGYSRLAAEDERAAVRLLHLLQQTAREEIARADGHLVKLIGDGVFAEFGSTEAAVRAALGLQRSFIARSRAAAVDAALRIGVHVGDVITAPDGDLYGDGINVAARLKSEAEPGRVVASEDVWRQLRQRREYRFTALGERELKGMSIPVAIFSVESDEQDTVHPGEPEAATDGEVVLLRTLEATPSGGLGRNLRVGVPVVVESEGTGSRGPTEPA